MGKQGVNLQDTRHGFRAAMRSVTREFARIVMCQGIAKNPRQTQIMRNRSTVNFMCFED